MRREWTGSIGWGRTRAREWVGGWVGDDGGETHLISIVAALEFVV
jgi:hypothetical protein